MVKQGRFYDEQSGHLLWPEVRVMDYFPQRLVGMLYHKLPPADVAFWFPRCRTIHTWGMRFPIQVIGLDSEYRVLAVHPQVPPGQVVRIAGADSMIECCASIILDCPLWVGQQLQFRWSEQVNE